MINQNVVGASKRKLVHKVNGTLIRLEEGEEEESKSRETVGTDEPGPRVGLHARTRTHETAHTSAITPPRVTSRHVSTLLPEEQAREGEKKGLGSGREKRSDPNRSTAGSTAHTPPP